MTKSSKPLVTVLIATYNYEKYISFAIESVINQTYPTERIEIIVVDDGSKDKTGEIVSGFADKINLTYIFQENKGKAAATKLGIQHASGKYLFVLDADDYYLSDCISTVVDCFESDERIVQVSHLANRLDEITGKSVQQVCSHNQVNIPVPGLTMLYNSIFKGFNIGLGSTFAARTTNLKNINIPPEVDMYIDYYLFLKLTTQGYVVQLDKILSVFRRHNNSYSEGKEKFETGKVRASRYLKSSHALFLAMKEEKQIPVPVLRWLKLFYYQHLVSSSKYIASRALQNKINLITLAAVLFPKFSNKKRFFIANFKLLMK